MIPTYFVQVVKIPLTPNGKVNRKALPKPGLKVGDSYTAPANEIEKKLVELWSEILGIDSLHVSHLQSSIGIDDNFFELGGHSLKATILISKIHKALNVKLPLSEIFKNPSIRKLSWVIKMSDRDEYTSILKTEEKEYYEISSAQKRLYILNSIQDLNTTYNLPTAFMIKGKMDIFRFQDAFQALIQRHESLRTSFQMMAGAPVHMNKSVLLFISWN
jgi:acyl carrier protein